MAATGVPASACRRSLLEFLYPGCTAAWNGKAYMDYWTGDPWHRGSYSYGKVGQYTQFIGIEGVPQGNVHFAGEHVSIDFAGFMNGAVETGQSAAAAILRAMKPSASSLLRYNSTPGATRVS